MTSSTTTLSEISHDIQETRLSSCEKWQKLCLQGQDLLRHNSNTNDLSSKISQLFLGSAINKGCHLSKRFII